MARVLIVEPDRRIRKFIAGILADFGHQVEQCSDVRDARRWLSRVRFDVLATDLVLAETYAGDLTALAPSVPVLTLRGRRFHPGADDADRPARLHSTPFRFADLAALVAAIGAPGPVAQHVAQDPSGAHPLAGSGEGTRPRVASAALA